MYLKHRPIDDNRDRTLERRRISFMGPKFGNVPEAEMMDKPWNYICVVPEGAHLKVAPVAVFHKPIRYPKGVAT